ncbi:ABC transporter permease [Celeribacter marinus]|uniref:ABC transporter, permease protein n=1 Tax=Celeribacter marinus TaxID=1397108 RepID=A0A0N9ZQ53_9RHOB|nr:ABC transporter permease [Celeribacter marinus]ALI55770.1 ABC transporter, permease protein [Celeribacter marinus]SFK91783.1 ABC-type polysaccharide/polyol phosphate export permease [Celeribacter marinus]
MFKYSSQQNGFSAAFNILRLIFHNTVRHVRKSHGSPLIGLITNISQAIILVAVFSFMMSILGISRNSVRGDFILFIMSGIFLFLTHNKTLGDVASAESGTSPMMQHAPMNTAISITSAALSALYIQFLSVAVILTVYQLGWGGVEFQYLPGAFAMFMMAWFSGAAIGTVVLAAKPWAPEFVRVVQTLYTRANMFTSGKMFLANAMPGFMLAFFKWNPLFHTIDQARGYTFVNYNPHYSSPLYPLMFSLVFLTIGLLAEFFTRKRASASWSAR